MIGHIEDTRGNWWRYVQHRLYGDAHTVGVGWRVVAYGSRMPTLEALEVRLGLLHDGIFRHRFRHRFTHLPPEHAAFVAGVMPPWVYADWVEENFRDFPAEWLAVLRMEVTA